MDYIDKARKSVELTMKHLSASDASLEQLNFGMLTAIADATIAQAEAATRQAAALEKIAAALYTSDGDLHVLDALYGIASILNNHP